MQSSFFVSTALLLVVSVLVLVSSSSSSTKVNAFVIPIATTTTTTTTTTTIPTTPRFAITTETDKGTNTDTDTRIDTKKPKKGTTNLKTSSTFSSARNFFKLPSENPVDETNTSTLTSSSTSTSSISTPTTLSSSSSSSSSSTFSYVEFAKEYPFVNNVGIATVKTAAADLLAQTVTWSASHDVLLSSASTSSLSFPEIDFQRSLLFALFGFLYTGAFQYVYQVQIFKRMFDNIDDFTNKDLQDKLKDIPGLTSLAAQTGLDLTVLTLVYLPTFYIFKASVFSGDTAMAAATAVTTATGDVVVGGGGGGGEQQQQQLLSSISLWVDTGLSTWQSNFHQDESDLLKVWFPADLICFSVPLYLRLPVRHIVSFAWTAYLSFSRGGH